MLVLTALVLRLWAPPSPEPPPGPGTPRGTTRAETTLRIERVMLDADAPLQSSLQGALALRMAPTPVTAYEGATPGTDGLRVYVYVQDPHEDRYRVEVIVSDGRAYAREIVAPEAMAGRILGGELALLLRGIEEGTLVPDRHDAVIPGSDAVGPVDDREASLAPAKAPLDDPEPHAADAPRLELGLFTGGGGSFGVAPAPDIAASGIGLGELGFELRWPTGASVSADLRVGGRRSSPFSVVRTRIALGGGYVLRRGTLELPLRAWLGVEPWGVRANGRGTPVVPIDGAARQVPLLGLVLRADPGLRLSFAERPALAVRIGPYVELAASAVWSDGVGAPRLRAAGTGEVVARLGGLELGLGLGLQLWLATSQGPLRGRPPRATP